MQLFCSFGQCQLPLLFYHLPFNCWENLPQGFSVSSFHIFSDSTRFMLLNMFCVLLFLPRNGWCCVYWEHQCCFVLFMYFCGGGTMSVYIAKVRTLRVHYSSCTALPGICACVCEVPRGLGRTHAGIKSGVDKRGSLKRLLSMAYSCDFL